MVANDVIIENEKDEDLQLEDLQLAENRNIEPDEPIDFNEKRENLGKTKIVKQTWSILEIYQKISSEKLKLDPDYQRNEIWDEEKKTSFIESLFMGIIIPPVYVVEIPGYDILNENSYEVVDGKQRLSTIKKFISGEITLKSRFLEYYSDWFGNKNFMQIRGDYNELTSEMLSSVLDIYVITANSPEFTKYDIFSRLNKGAEKLKVNEIRKAVYRSTALNMIDEFVKRKVLEPEYKEIFTNNDIKRYEDYGRFYRSLAFFIRSDVSTKKVENYNSRPRDMINSVLQTLQQKKYIEDEQILNILTKTIEMLKFFKSNPMRNHNYIIDACIPFITNENLLTSLKDIMNDDKVLKTLEQSPSTTSNVNERFGRICDIFEESV